MCGGAGRGLSSLGTRDISQRFPLPLWPARLGAVWLGAADPLDDAGVAGIGGRWLGRNARVNSSKWIGGDGKALWPGAQAYPYWLNGAVPLAASLADPDLTAEIHRQIDIVCTYMCACAGSV